MKVLRKVNSIVAIGILIAMFYHFFIDSIDLSMSIIYPFTALIFLQTGIENVKEKDGDKKLGYAYLVIVLLSFTGLILELVKFI